MLDKEQRDVSLIIAERDTAKERERFEKMGEKAIEKIQEKKKEDKKRNSLALEKIL